MWRALARHHGRRVSIVRVVSHLNGTDEISGSFGLLSVATDSVASSTNTTSQHETPFAHPHRATFVRRISPELARPGPPENLERGASADKMAKRAGTEMRAAPLDRSRAGASGLSSPCGGSGRRCCRLS
jgi:hypothetical protein